MLLVKLSRDAGVFLVLTPALQPKKAQRQEYQHEHPYAHRTLPGAPLQAAIEKRQPHQQQPENTRNDQNPDYRDGRLPILQVLKDRNVIPLRPGQKQSVRRVSLGAQHHRQPPRKKSQGENDQQGEAHVHDQLFRVEGLGGQARIDRIGAGRSRRSRFAEQINMLRHKKQDQCRNDENVQNKEAR